MGKMLNCKESKFENEMGTINHQAKPLIAQIKDEEARRGAVTCFKATELSGRQIKAFLPGESSTIKNQINKKTWAKHRPAPITVRKKRWGGGGLHPMHPHSSVLPLPPPPALRSDCGESLHFGFHSALEGPKEPHGNLYSLAVLCVLG